MEPYDHTENGTVRMSNSPRRSPQITQGLKSPVRSLHPQLQQTHSSQSNKDPGMRTLDFFDDSSGDEDNSPVDPADTAPDVDGLERRGSATKKRQSNPTPAPGNLPSQCESKTIKLSPAQDGYQPLSPSAWADAPDHVPDRADTPSTSFNGSVDELLPSNMHSSPPQFQRSSRISSGRTPRTSAHIPRSDDRQSSLPPAPAPPAPTAARPSTIGAYALAHQITLEALMRDEETLDRSLQSVALAPLQASADRRSLLPAALSVKDDPRSPKIRDFSSPQSLNSAGTSKRVHVVPPPIDVHDSGRRSIPADIVRTPYPFSPEHVRVQRKDFGYAQPPDPAQAVQTGGSAESVLTLSIRRTHANSKARVTSITIPAANDFTAVRHSGIRQKEQHFKALDFDDAELFRQIRAAYIELSGPARWFSARTLCRIVVARSSSSIEGGGGWHNVPRSPRELAYKGLNDTFSEEKLLLHFRHLGKGKGQYAFVHWAHRLAASPSSPTIRTPRPGETDDDEEDGGGLMRRAEQPEGLEFVLGWSCVRILAALGLVLVMSIAAALLWTLLGKNSASIPGPPGQGAGFRGAGDRVTSGVLMGIGVLLVGLSGLGGWVGGSWLLM